MHMYLLGNPGGAERSDGLAHIPIVLLQCERHASGMSRGIRRKQAHAHGRGARTFKYHVTMLLST
jgi:hypothetical protein